MWISNSPPTKYYHLDDQWNEEMCLNDKIPIPIKLFGKQTNNNCRILFFSLNRKSAGL